MVAGEVNNGSAGTTNIRLPIFAEIFHFGMQVFKFGGASVKDAEGVRNVGEILEKYGSGPLLVVISAMGKMTNALEELTNSYIRQDGKANELFAGIQQYHLAIAKELLPDGDPVFSLINDHFVEIEWVLESEPEDSYDYIYDQIVSQGELISTRIVSAYLEKAGLKNRWKDARDLIRTDESYREGRVDWPATRARVSGLLTEGRLETMVITQGFIAGTANNTTTTLGREGSDYSAAIFANCLDAVSMSIWKDVPGILSADPKDFEDVLMIERLSFREAIEMTYYGAKVIHPKTIKPLQNKQIPLWVRSFEDPASVGTHIGSEFEPILPPIIVLEKEQALIQIATRDFSFVAEHHISHIFQLFAKARIKINLMRNTAISFTACATYDPAKFRQFVDELGDDFKVVVDTGLELITVRHYSEAVVEELIRNVRVVLEERFERTIQLIVQRAPLMKRK